MSWFDKLKASVTRSRDALLGLETMALAKRPLDASFWDEFEEILISADFGFSTTEKIVSSLQGVAKQDRYQTSDQVIARFKRDVKNFLTLPDMGLQLERKPAVILIVGVNGSGKTTTIGKLATAMKRNRRKVLLVAADYVSRGGGRTAYDLGRTSGRGNRARERGRGSVIGRLRRHGRREVTRVRCRAGRHRRRLQTKTNLMEELKKMRRVIERETGAPPAETLLVLDGTTGQNALSQAKLFNEATQLTGVIVTKLDSTAKGGVLVGIVDQLTVPIKIHRPRRNSGCSPAPLSILTSLRKRFSNRRLSDCG